jgi:UDP-glucuronate decarboxylase
LFSDYRWRFAGSDTLARIFNTSGPRMQIDDGCVVSNFIVQALRNEPISIYGDGQQTRAFCYVDEPGHYGVT